MTPLFYVLLAVSVELAILVIVIYRKDINVSQPGIPVSFYTIPGKDEGFEILYRQVISIDNRNESVYILYDKAQKQQYIVFGNKICPRQK